MMRTMLGFILHRFLGRRRWPPPRELVASLVCSVAALVAASSCNSDEADAVGSGELGYGWFEYRCVGSLDPVCIAPAEDAFPRCISLGASFGLRYEATRRQFVDAQLEAANPSYYTGDGSSFTARQLGRAAIVVRHRKRVLDYVHFRIEAPSKIVVRNPDEDVEVEGELVLAPGTSTELIVYAGGPCSTMGGSLPGRARSLDPSVATAQLGESLRITAHAPGVTDIVVELGELERHIVVEVPSPRPPPPKRTSSSGDESSTGSTGDDTDSTDGTDGTDTDGTGSTAGDSTDSGDEGSTGGER